jgi:hypothetical protein
MATAEIAPTAQSRRHWSVSKDIQGLLITCSYWVYDLQRLAPGIICSQFLKYVLKQSLKCHKILTKSFTRRSRYSMFSQSYFVRKRQFFVLYVKKTLMLKYDFLQNT